MTTPIPQPKPLPLLGNVLDIDGKNGVQSLMRLAARHGPISGSCSSAARSSSSPATTSSTSCATRRASPRRTTGRWRTSATSSTTASSRPTTTSRAGHRPSLADPGVRAAVGPRHAPAHARHRRADAAAVGALRRRADRRDRPGDAAHPRHDRALRLRFSLQQLLPDTDASVRRGDARRAGRGRPAGAAAWYRHAAHGPQPAPFRPQQDDHVRPRRRARRPPPGRGRRAARRPARQDAGGPRPRHRRGARRREHPLPDGHLPRRRARDDQRAALARPLPPAGEPPPRWRRRAPRSIACWAPTSRARKTSRSCDTSSRC